MTNATAAIQYGTPTEYIDLVKAERGAIMHSNRIGALTVITAFRSLGNFETVLWDGRHPDSRGIGERVALQRTLQSADAFHYGYAKLLWESPFGGEPRERVRWFGDEIAELVSEIEGT